MAYDDLRDGALTAVRLFGCEVFPCHPRSKKPATLHGFKDASADVEQVLAWWNANPEYNPAMRTGDVVVIDLDDHRGEGGAFGLDWFREYQEEHGEAPKTLCVMTGRGEGMHLYYRNPKELSISNSANSAIGVDVRGFGGYVMLPPSIHPETGSAYEYMSDPEETQLAPVDDYVLAMMDAARPAKGGERCIAEGGRNNALFREACRLQGAGLDDDRIFEQVHAMNDDACESPLPSIELDRTIQSALSYPKGELAPIVQLCHEYNLYARHINDATMGKAFALAYGGTTAWVPEVKKGGWCAYDGRCWVFSGGREIAELRLKTFVRAATAYAATLSDDDARANAMKAMQRYQQHSARMSVLADAQSEMVRHLDEFDKAPHLLNVANATLDFSGGEVAVYDHRATDMITRIAPVEYDPDAGCELYESTLADVFELDFPLMEYWQKLLGKALAGNTADDEFYLAGEQPRAGKSTLVHPWVAMLGDGANGYCRNTQPETFAVVRNRNASSSSSDRARLDGARLVVASEPPQGMELDATLVKTLTGGDMLCARGLYSDDAEFQFRGVIIMLCNSFPQCSDPSVLASGRAVCIPFNRFRPKADQDKTLRERLCEKRILSGLLNWGIEGHRMYCKDGFKKPEAVVAASRSYEAKMDAVAAYIGARLVRSDDAKLAAKDAYADYGKWSSAANLPWLPKPDFYARVRQRCPWSDRTRIDGKMTRQVILGYELRK